MKAYEYLLFKQIQWAQNKGIELVGSQGNRGRPLYVQNLKNNLFEPLTPEVEKAFRAGDGGELAGEPAKMQAIHSSSALSVNVFQYWNKIGKVSQIAQACGFCSKTTEISKRIVFEAKYPIDDRFQYSPNIDVVIKNVPGARYKVYAIECKFTEAYRNVGHLGLKEKYLELAIWNDIPHLYELAISISPREEKYQYIHAAQLIKHILGLKRAYGKTGFRLLYLWYDTLGREGAKHREEVEEFLEIARADGIKMHGLTYQELIVRLAERYRDKHREYIEYVTCRYL